jgi:uncharacterized protein (DUF952 family)
VRQSAFKVFTASEWRQFETEGTFLGAPVDLVDGYIHMSTADQLEETLSKHFAGQTGLVIAEVDLKALKGCVKWEVSRGGAFFPHLYGTLPMTAITSSQPR